MKITNRNNLNQFVIIPTVGVAWGEKGTHIYFTWLRFRLGLIL